MKAQTLSDAEKRAPAISGRPTPLRSLLDAQYARTPMTSAAAFPVLPDRGDGGEALEAEPSVVHMLDAFEAVLTRVVEDIPGHAELLHQAVVGGHRTRPLACLLCCDAAGGRWQDALSSAACVELIHKSSVIRDDIADGDISRSGHVTLQARFGIPLALAVSDVLWAVGLELIGAELLAAAHQRLAVASIRALGEMARGQLEDLAPSRGQGSVAARLRVDEQKTGALTELACLVGAAIGGADERQQQAFASYGRKVGTAFQVINDVRNVEGVESDREPASDIRGGRDTVVTAHARAAGVLPATLPVVPRRLHSEETVASLRTAALQGGSVEFCRTLAADLLGEARRALKVIQPTPARELMLGLARSELFSIYAFGDDPLPVDGARHEEGAAHADT
jgi:geranylgeranyl pyrophosphate synthase